jgi:methylthioribose-1-phosphate isomerase
MRSRISPAVAVTAALSLALGVVGCSKPDPAAELEKTAVDRTRPS